MRSKKKGQRRSGTQTLVVHAALSKPMVGKHTTENETLGILMDGDYFNRYDGALVNNTSIVSSLYSRPLLADFTFSTCRKLNNCFSIPTVKHVVALILPSVYTYEVFFVKRRAVASFCAIESKTRKMAIWKTFLIHIFLGAVSRRYNERPAAAIQILTSV